MVTVDDRARRIDATAPTICCTASGDKPPIGYEVLGIDTTLGGMSGLDTIDAVAGG